MYPIKYFRKTRVPVLLWIDQDTKDDTLQQAENAASLPFVFKQVCVMPDGHQGYGVPIGSIVATKMTLIPYAVGADAFCGVRTVRTNLRDISLDDAQKIVDIMLELMPVGLNWHKTKQDVAFDIPENCPVINSQWDKLLYQVGTLGSNNHFWSIDKGSDGFIYVTVHTGSRNVGKRVADYYHKKAIELNEKWYSCVDPKTHLSFLPFDSEYGRLYWNELDFLGKFAKTNRELITKYSEVAFKEVLGDVKFREYIDVHHNFASIENHFRKNVIVHRKGATRAFKDQLGIIPGSAETGTWIVKGKGNPVSFMSCSHGAGRTMGRNEAKRKLNFEEELAKLDGMIHYLKTENNLQEAPSAYKPLSEVMERQKALVEPLVHLQTIAVIKG